MTRTHDTHPSQSRRARIAASVVALGVLIAFIVGTAVPHFSGGQGRDLFPAPPPAGAGAGRGGGGGGGGAEGDGSLDGRTVAITDTDEPAVSGLQADLRAAVLDATNAAAADGIEVRITSGWRSPSFQQRLLDDAVERYGSHDEARRWVQTSEGSSHVTGDAVDVGPTDAAYWMAQHGHRFGLCQTYANEIWHYELTVSPGEQCPPPAADPSS